LPRRSGLVVSSLLVDFWVGWSNPAGVYSVSQSCQIFLFQFTQTGENVQKYQVAIKYTCCQKQLQTTLKYTNIFHSKALRNIPKIKINLSDYACESAATYVPTFEFLTVRFNGANVGLRVQICPKQIPKRTTHSFFHSVFTVLSGLTFKKSSAQNWIFNSEPALLLTAWKVGYTELVMKFLSTALWWW
jgi:hypothetical protein